MVEKKKFLRDVIAFIAGGILLEPTLKALNADGLVPYLPQVWFVILWALTLDGLSRSKRIREWASRLYKRLDIKRKMASWLIVGLIGLTTSLIYWGVITGVFKVRASRPVSATNDQDLNINRALLPIKDVFVSFRVNIPLDHPAFFGYRKRLEKCMERMATTKKLECGAATRTVRIEDNLIIKQLDTVFLPPGTEIFPDERTEAVLYSLLSYLKITFQIFKPAPTVEKLHEASPDIVFSIAKGLQDEENIKNIPPNIFFYIDVAYESRTKTLFMVGTKVPVDSANWTSNGKILSIPELSGSLLMVSPGLRVRSFTGVPDTPNSYKEREESTIGLQVVRGLVVQDLVLTINGRELKAPSLVQIKNRYGIPSYVTSIVD
jgi:hypothetical protein